MATKDNIMSIEEALLIIKGFEKVMEQMLKTVDDFAFRSDLFFHGVHKLRSLIKKWDKK